jgi:hypothetical protein
MPPRLQDYNSVDWIRIRPILHRLKTMRYRRIDRSYRALPARFGDLTSVGKHIRQKNVLVTIAYTDPQTIAWQAPLVKRFIPDAVYIVADNTPDAQQALAIRDVAASFNVPYLWLPHNPTTAASRSHGLALNWVWHNVIQPHEPAAFGFIDDDMFPTAPTDPFAALSQQDFFGVVRPGISTSTLDASGRWFLWAGFSMFKFRRVQNKPLDFSQDWFLGLDTGGANWDVLYRHVSRNDILEQETIFVPFRDGLNADIAPLQWCGPWLHEVGFQGREYANEKRSIVAQILANHLTDHHR